jgi:hypothetical protein
MWMQMNQMNQMNQREEKGEVQRNEFLPQLLQLAMLMSLEVPVMAIKMMKRRIRKRT